MQKLITFLLKTLPPNLRYFNPASHNLSKYFELSSQHIIKYECVLYVFELRTGQFMLG